MQQFTQLHAAMADSLNGGSLNGVTYQAILDRSIESDGFLDVRGIANFRKNVRITGNLLIDQILNVSENATIGGITYSNNGMRANVVENLGAFSSAGSIRFGTGLEVYGTAALKSKLVYKATSLFTNPRQFWVRRLQTPCSSWSL